MELKYKVIIFGFSFYSLGWFLLVISGMGVIEISGLTLCFAGIFTLGTLIPIIINKDCVNPCLNESEVKDG